MHGLFRCEQKTKDIRTHGRPEDPVSCRKRPEEGARTISFFRQPYPIQ